MDRLIYVAMSGARAAMKAQTATSHNLANVGTTGFRALRNAMDSAPVHGAGLPTRVNTVAGMETWNTAQGSAVATGRDLDIAIVGDGWLAVQGHDGNEAYTRAGNLRINPNGLLETAAGHLVLGNGGPIAIPPFQELYVGDDGQISIVPQGQTPESLVQVDRLRLVNPAVDDIERSAGGLFRLRSGGGADADPAVRIVSGQLESSNVNSAQALVDRSRQRVTTRCRCAPCIPPKETDAAASRLIRMGG